MKDKQKRVICIGGGAAGYFCAINTARWLPLAEVLIVEKTRQPLAKVRISGGGRCNVTHHCFEPKVLCKHYPRGGDFLRRALHTFQPKDMIAWMKERGVELNVESDGRMFPGSNSSKEVIDCFANEARIYGVTVLLDNEVLRIERADDGLILHRKEGEPLLCDAAVMATGGNPRSYSLVEGLGHTVLPAVASLFTFHINDDRLTDLSGVSVPYVKAQIVSTDIHSEGPLLITHWGLSGPAILRLSAWAARQLAEKNYHAEVKINWLGAEKEGAARRALGQSRLTIGSQKVSLYPLFGLPKSLWKRLVESANIPPERVYGQMTKKEELSLCQALEASIFTIHGKSAHKEEFVTCGGVPLDEIDLKTMESKMCPGLYFAGEVIDVDGITGGFNFQNAWTTAWLAAHAITKKLE